MHWYEIGAALISVAARLAGVAERTQVKSMSVHVVGAGALGSMIAARLSAAGVETRLVLRAKSGRWRAVDATSRVRVLVDGAPHDVATAPDARDAKLVLLCTKVWQARDALRQAKTSAKVVALCNGALSLADDATIVPAVTTHGCFETQPFDVTHAGPGTLWVSDEEAFATLSASETLNVVRVSEAEMTERLWKKLAVSCVLNPLTALHSCRNGEALPGREETCRAVCAEIASLDDCPCTTPNLEEAIYQCVAENAACDSVRCSVVASSLAPCAIRPIAARRSSPNSSRRSTSTHRSC